MAHLPPNGKDLVRTTALKAGASTCGFARAADFELHAPERHRPADLLPGAKSVIVVGGARPRAGDWVSASPWVLESMGTNDRIHSVARRIAQYIEQEFHYYALFVPPGLESGMNPFLSMTLAAELAGLGSRSLAGPILNREFGLLYYSAVITTMPLEPDPPETEPVCPTRACRDQWEQEGTTPCLKTCPAQAGGCLDGRLENGKAVRTFYDRERCHTRVHTHWIGGFQKALEAALDEPDKEKRKMILFGDFFTRTLWAMTYSSTNISQCFECMRVCPAAHGLTPME